MKEVIQKYKNAHKWLLIPWIIIIIGFTPQYFSSWLSEPWAYHLHALSAMFWYVLIVIQPYLATHGKLKKHRLWGMIGLFIAGGVIFSALSITPINVYLGAKGGFPPVFPASFFYGLTFTETLAISGFGTAVLMAIIKSKNHEDHAIWMLSTVFFGMMPAWVRVIMFPVLMTGSGIDVQTALNIGTPVFLLVIIFIAYRLRKLTHPAIILSFLFALIMIFTNLIGGQEWYQDLVTRIMKPYVPWNI